LGVKQDKSRGAKAASSTAYLGETNKLRSLVYQYHPEGAQSSFVGHHAGHQQEDEDDEPDDHDEPENKSDQRKLPTRRFTLAGRKP
jgi:hypothetical protein